MPDYYYELRRAQTEALLLSERVLAEVAVEFAGADRPLPQRARGRTRSTVPTV